MRTILCAALVAAFAIPLSACSDPDGARQLLEDQGYTNVRMIGSPWFGGCDKHDYYVDEFKADSPAGRPAHGVVCSGGGWGKASTIRLYSKSRW